MYFEFEKANNKRFPTLRRMILLDHCRPYWSFPLFVHSFRSAEVIGAPKSFCAFTSGIYLNVLKKSFVAKYQEIDEDSRLLVNLNNQKLAGRITEHWGPAVNKVGDTDCQRREAIECVKTPMVLLIKR